MIVCQLTHPFLSRKYHVTVAGVLCNVPITVYFAGCCRVTFRARQRASQDNYWLFHRHVKSDIRGYITIGYNMLYHTINALRFNVPDPREGNLCH